ncbi:MAG TPA: RIP metalloprotease RseP [Gemmatimonas sp.]|nr:RIP metalloprotease RseP [Gemmatimonas sp.]
MKSIASMLAPFLVFGLVVFVHELGHFLAAKLAGVYAPVFSLGWGRRLFGVRRGETDYRVSLIPLGGYVRMATREDDAMAGIEGGADRGSLDPHERPADVAPGLWDPNAMAPFGPKAVPPDRWVENKSVPARVFILSAGVLMNILLTIVVSSWIFFSYGTYGATASLSPVVDSVTVGSAAAAAGVAPGDSIVAINRQPVQLWSEVLDRVGKASGQPVDVEVQRGTERISTTMTPRLTAVIDPQTGDSSMVPRIGVMVRNPRVPVGFVESIQYGTRATWSMTTNVASTLKGLVSGSISTKNLGGPIAIARTSVQAAKSGAETLWSLIAFLSINIAILNLVPIPVLDGGQILLVLAEAVKGKAFSGRAREAFARVGVLAVLALIILVTFNDLRAVFTR